MVDAALAETGTTQKRVRDLPSRVMIYLLLAAALFAELGYRQVWARLVAGLDGLAVATPTAGALAQARRRIGPAPLRTLFDLLRGPGAGPATKGVYWRGRWCGDHPLEPHRRVDEFGIGQAAGSAQANSISNPDAPTARWWTSAERHRGRRRRRGTYVRLCRS